LTSEVISADPHSQNGTVSYAYDSVGNRQQMASTLPPVPAGVFFYDANDRLTTDTYDNDGNTVSFAGIQNTYDFENHMVQKGAVKLVYDGDGNRVSETVGGVTTNYLMDTQNPTGYAQVVDELVGGTVTRSYRYGLERISESQTLNSAWTLSFYGYDGHGSVRQLTNSAGAVTDSYDYDAFGNILSQTGSTPNYYLFAGEQYDSALGLYYNRARYLDTNTGRFWSMDTFESNDWEPASLHRYLYAGANPVDRVDPSGNDFDLGSIAIGAAVSGTIDAISAINAHQTLAGVAKSFVIGSVKGAAFFLAGGIAFKLLATAGEAAASLEAVQAASEFFGNVVSKAGPLIEGLQLPRYFSLSTEAGEIFVKQNATKHLEELLLKAGSAGATRLAAALAVEEVKAAVEAVAAEGFDAVAGKLVTTQVGSYTVEIVIEAQPGQAVQYAITHLLFM
jgi:RHS repeat-associated protein